ncbi:MAG: hypothetical protein JWP01_2946 [Myxococcales bacterium]|nr:hypothetical protein [Myxococcales bacterium]
MMVSACATTQIAAHERLAAPTTEAPGDVHAPGTIDLQQYRLDLALQARDLLRKRWLAWGAIPRPPMPALLAEIAGEPPFPGAVWTPGRWVWTHGRWEWRRGSWSDPDVFLDAEVFVGADIGTGIDAHDETLRDHRRRERIRDHRDDDSGSSIRDHRDRESSKAEPTVRDHRNNHDDTPKSTVRDHRDDKKENDDDKSTIRDHRRR